MNKTIKAFLMGYLFFAVNDKLFFRYNSALAERKRIDGDLRFIGFNIWHKLFSKYGGWRSFYLRLVNPRTNTNYPDERMSL